MSVDEVGVGSGRGGGDFWTSRTQVEPRSHGLAFQTHHLSAPIVPSVAICASTKGKKISLKPEAPSS